MPHTSKPMDGDEQAPSSLIRTIVWLLAKSQTAGGQRLEEGTRSKPAKGQRPTAELAVGAGDVDVEAGLAERDGDMVTEAVAVHIAPLALHDVRQALGAEPEHYVALVRRRHLHLEALRAPRHTTP